MSEEQKLPSWLPEELANDLKARFGGNGKLAPIKTELGVVVLRAPSRQAIIDRFPPPPNQTEARGMMKTEDGDLDKDATLAMAAACYPDQTTLRTYIAKLPMLAPHLAARAKFMATGFKGELKGAPSDLNFSALEATGIRPYQMFCDLDPGRLVLRAPSADAIRQWESARQRQSGIQAAETFVYSCLLHPAVPIVQDMFTKRPLFGVYCANRLFSWGLGEVEEFEGGL